jgi:hypothetical protein
MRIMKKDPRLILIILQSLIIGVLLVFIVIGSFRQTSGDLNAESDLLIERARFDSLEMILVDLNKAGGIPPLLDQQQIKSLREKGLENPVDDLRNNLMKEDVIIKRKGVLGGTMGFYMPEGIHVLNEKWVVAYFEDGHVAGALLLKYEVKEGSINWEVLDEILF